MIHHFHHRAEHSVLPVITFLVLALKFRAKLILVPYQMRHISHGLLHGIDFSIGVFVTDEAAEAVGNKHPGDHHVGNVRFAHPTEPVLVYIEVYCNSDVVEEHLFVGLRDGRDGCGG